jgi:hypothetical protein
MSIHDGSIVADDAKAGVSKLLLPFGAHAKKFNKVITGWLSLSLFLHHLLLSPLHSTQEKEEQGEKALELNQIKAGVRTPYNCYHGKR